MSEDKTESAASGARQDSEPAAPLSAEGEPFAAPMNVKPTVPKRRVKLLSVERYDELLAAIDAARAAAEAAERERDTLREALNEATEQWLYRSHGYHTWEKQRGQDKETEKIFGLRALLTTPAPDGG